MTRRSAPERHGKRRRGHSSASSTTKGKGLYSSYSGGLVPELLCAGSGFQHAGTIDLDVPVNLETACGAVDTAQHLRGATPYVDVSIKARCLQGYTGLVRVRVRIHHLGAVTGADGSWLVSGRSRPFASVLCGAFHD